MSRGFRGRFIACAVLLVGGAGSAVAAEHELRSPDGRIALEIRSEERIRYAVRFEGRELVSEALLSLRLGDETLGTGVEVRSADTDSVDRWLEPAVPRKAARVRERYNQLRLQLAGDYAVTFRAYDSGVAHRFETSRPDAELRVYDEEAVFRFAGDWPVHYPREESFFSHNERQYQRVRLSEIGPEAVASMPALVEAPGGVRIAVAESDLMEYPGMWLRGTDGYGLQAVFPPYPLELALERDRDLKVARAADYIAVTSGTRSYPWRILGISATDADLITSELVWLLAAPSQIEDTSWIRPGKVAWDWWNALNLYGVDFESGVNTRTYEHYIDFAARHGLEYVILDEGWYPLGDALGVVPEIDMARLSRYARDKGVGLILWMIWNTLDDDLEAALDKYAAWGVSGLKIDFMQRDDQLVIDYYHRVSRMAAERRMLVDYHGGQKPALLTRTWPNLITAEGVMGLEHVKWSELPDPEHDLTLLFTRMYLGPLDYTPGATVNASEGFFAPLFETPMSRGTRCHQLALYVALESPLQMLADSPSNYEREPEMMEFLAPIPTVWDETRVLHAKLGDYVALARRSGSEWWLGALTDWSPRELELDLSFLAEGHFTLDAWEDGPNAHRHGRDFRRATEEVDSSTRRAVRLAPGGGWVARIRPVGGATR